MEEETNPLDQLLAEHQERELSPEVLERVFFLGQQVMEQVEKAVTTLELEIGGQGDAFNHLLERTDRLDEKIESLAKKISEAKVAWVRASMQAIEADVQQAAGVLRQAGHATPAEADELEENLVVLRENREVAEDEAQRLRDMGADTGEIDRRIEALDRALLQLEHNIARLKQGELASVSARAHNPQQFKAELLQMAQDGMRLAREALSEDSDVHEVKQLVDQLLARFAAVPAMAGHQEWEMAQKTLVQTERALGQRLLLHVSAFLQDQLGQLHVQIDAAKETGDPEDIPVLRENWAAFEENLMLVAGEINGLPEALRGSVSSQLQMVMEEWRRLEMVIGEAAQRMSLA